VRDRQRERERESGQKVRYYQESSLNRIINHVCDVMSFISLLAAVETVQRRAWRRLSLDRFAFDMQASALCGDIDSLGEMYMDDLCSSGFSTTEGGLCPSVTVGHKP